MTLTQEQYEAMLAKQNTLDELRAKLLVRVAKRLTEISVYDVSPTEKEGYRKDTLEGIYFTTYKTRGKSPELEKLFVSVSKRLYRIAVKTNYNPGSGFRITPDYAAYAFHFWKRQRTNC